MKIWNLLVPLICSILATGALSFPGPSTSAIDLESFQNLSTNNTDDSTIITGGGLFRRAETPQLQKCPDGIPFSCPKTSKCTPTTPKKDSVICCPAGGNCNFIKPVACDVRQQDPSKYPAAVLHTTQLDAKLQKCGEKCCPLGYGCEDGMCAMKKENAAKEGDKPSASKEASKPTKTPSASQSGEAAKNDEEKEEVKETSSSSSKFPPGAVVLGIFVGLAIGAGLTALIVLLLRRRTQKKTKTLKRQSSNFMGHTPTEPNPNGGAAGGAAGAAAAAGGPNNGRSNSPSNHKTKGSYSSNVSEPMWAPNYGPPTHRTDFLLRRGDVETGMERNNPNAANTPDPNAASNLERGMSNKRGPRKPDQAHQQQQQHSMTTRRGSRLPPLFATPLKLGLPSSPRSPIRSPGSGGRISKMSRPQRPRRSDDSLKNMIAQKSQQGGTRSTAEAVHGNETTNKPMAAPAAANQDRYGFEQTPEREARQRQRDYYGLERSDSDTTILTESPLEDPDAKAKEWGLSTMNPFTRKHDNKNHHREDTRDSGYGSHPYDSRIKSTETINVMFQTPELEKQQRKAREAGKTSTPETSHDRRDTTFEDLMKQAGWSPRGVPEVPKVPENHGGGGRKWGFR
ncbi:MAG: hypothetical protein M1831_003867 [Alyxoria varia]|nr:MAG: hypothetical protein M1831_003867 [Alyxoria varia]